ncbi:hypothetical protein BUALT_BualtUnG0032800 [Buddleja alternifolia]|uniref:Branched-chain-amino-acid aminotransferase n=1 Tax=Buddleja alternifolia TaxID=168488 RepID=A0AAV6W3I5_9LAMI|nr:hypothetical protein BUALT_BualtUnG0032800 [Buddleja alternifolia]
MESGAVFAGLPPIRRATTTFCPSRSAIKLLPPPLTDKKLFSTTNPLPLQLQKQSQFASFSNNVNSLRVASPTSNVVSELADIDWDNLVLGLFEGLKAYRKHDGNILLFRPEENAQRLRNGAERMCMPAPTVDQFLEAVKATVLANQRWEGLAPINLIVETEMHRATPGGTGGVKTIGNYAAVLQAQSAAKAKGYSDVLYLDSIHKKYLEEVSSCNVFVVKGNVISTPAIKGTILPGITRKSILDVARSQDFQVEERPVPVEELLDADEVFCTGTAVVVSPVGSITYLNKRVTYGSAGVGRVSQQLYSALTSLQMGLTEDTVGWITELK